MNTEDGRLSKEAEMVFKSVRQDFASWYDAACLSLDYDGDNHTNATQHA